MEYVCNICSRKFNKSQQLNAHKRRHKNNNYDVSKLKGYTDKMHQDKFEEYVKTSPTCNQCSNLLPFDKRNNKFCSNTCSSIFFHKMNNNRTKNSICIDCSKPVKINIQNSHANTRCINCRTTHKRKLQLNYQDNHNSNIEYTSLICSICKATFSTKIYNKKKIKQTCSKKCMRELCSLNTKGKCGGIREHSGFGKQSKYTKLDGVIINCQSTMELAICKILDMLNLKWKRNLIGFPYVGLDQRSHLYYPDFYIEKFDLFFETKGFFTKDTVHKLLNSTVPNLVVVTYNKWGGNFEDIIINPKILLNMFNNNDKSWISLIHNLPETKKYRYRVLPSVHLSENQIS